MSDYPHLFEPLQINRYIYKNRIIAGPILPGPFFQNEQTAALTYRRIETRAKGGAAAVQIGETSINYTDAARIPFRPIDYSVYSGPGFEGFKKYAGIIRKHGAIALVEIFHAGREKEPLPGEPNPRGPVGFVRENGVVVEAMNREMMDQACEDFATAAAFMQAAGFNGVLTHSGHGWLFSQFLSPLINTRTDKYGGSLENRARFPLEIFESIRKKVGPDFIIEARISGADGVPGGIEADDVGRFCHMLEGIVDSVHISVGLYKNPVVTNQFSSMFAPYGCNAHLSATIKKYTSLPVGVVGGINSPETAERIIAEGQADFVVLARQMIADPEFPNKAREGRQAEIRRCLRCYKCFPGSTHAGYEQAPDDGTPPQEKMGSCTINPRDKEERHRSGGARRVLIVGGGPAGMQAAISAAERGHRVTLVEKKGKLGGILNFTDMDVDKVDLRNFKNQLIYEVNSRAVEVKLNAEATPAFIDRMNPDVVILALGSSPIRLPIPGLNKALPALEVYDQGTRIGKRVVMIGGGLVGCETGLHLAKTGHQVTVVEMLKRLANDSYGMYHEALMLEMGKFNISSRNGERCLEIIPTGVMVETAKGEHAFIEADCVIYALGMRANSPAELHIAAGERPVFEVGDCQRVASVYEAVRNSYSTVMEAL
jgi:2,4-dienoyl-CoA reductase-like NADH-dependent reductase (Old Yellow Enzyme family)/thioredoxin reductase